MLKPIQWFPGSRLVVELPLLGEGLQSGLLVQPAGTPGGTDPVVVAKARWELRG
jgi:hypothetical protein